MRDTVLPAVQQCALFVRQLHRTSKAGETSAPRKTMHTKPVAQDLPPATLVTACAFPPLQGGEVMCALLGQPGPSAWAHRGFADYDLQGTLTRKVASVSVPASSPPCRVLNAAFVPSFSPPTPKLALLPFPFQILPTLGNQVSRKPLPMALAYTGLVTSTGLQPGQHSPDSPSLPGFLVHPAAF